MRDAWDWLAPGDAPRVGAAEDRHQTGGLPADVTKATHHSRRHGNGVPGFQYDLVFPVIAPDDDPLAGKRREDFDRQMAVQRRTLARIQPGFR